jgi:hypothetical protein
MTQDVSDSLGTTGRTLWDVVMRSRHTTRVEGRCRAVSLHTVPVSCFFVGPYRFVAHQDKKWLGT